MSHFYCDESLCIDLRYVAAVIPGQGDGPHDGKYWLCLMLDMGGKPRRIHADYPDLASRQAAFAALRTRLADAVAVGEDVTP